MRHIGDTMKIADITYEIEYTDQHPEANTVIENTTMTEEECRQIIYPIIQKLPRSSLLKQ